MSEVTIEKCLKYINNRFELVLISSKRAREIALKNVEPLVNACNDKPTIIALREIEEGHNLGLFEYSNNDLNSNKLSHEISDE
ncbi:MAG TPA: DNA-directed RNA polymerase subunit omega [Candidatus Azoamicus sp. OHIO1]